MTNLLIIDDFFGRKVPGHRNVERESLCRRLGLVERCSAKSPKPEGGLACATFFRGQLPVDAKVGDIVENDLDGCLARIEEGTEDGSTWDLLLLDLCFYTGEVTEASHADFQGFPEGRPEDDDPRTFFGLAILKAVKERFPQIPVAVFSAHNAEEVKAEAMRLGARGFIARDDPHAKDTLLSVLEGLKEPMRSLPQPPIDCGKLLKLARELPAPTITELTNMVEVLKELECVLLRRALRGALEYNRDEHGVVLLPSVKMLTSMDSLTTSQAADWMKRLVHQTRPHEALLLSDELIKEAYDMSMRLRPGASRKKIHD